MSIDTKSLSTTHPLLYGLIAALIMLTVTACAKNTPDERLLETAENVDDLAAEVQYISQQIREHENALDRLRKERSRVAAKLDTLEDRLAIRATDVALFRAVQFALLEEPSLQDTAINVRVERGEVSLHGLVASDAQRQRAIAISRATPGVSAVTSRIRLDDSDVKAS